MRIHGEKIEKNRAVIDKTTLMSYTLRVDFNKTTLEKRKENTMTAVSIKSTGSICIGALTATLALRGFEVSNGRSYVEACSDERNLAILPVTRCLSNKERMETTSVVATKVGISRFLRHYGLDPERILKQGIPKEEFTVSLDAGEDAIPCIGYCVCKYDYNDIEILVVPIYEIIERSKRGGIFSVAEKTGNFNFDFEKIGGNRTPEGAIVRGFFKGELAE